MTKRLTFEEIDSGYFLADEVQASGEEVGEALREFAARDVVVELRIGWVTSILELSGIATRATIRFSATKFLAPVDLSFTSIGGLRCLGTDFQCGLDLSAATVGGLFELGVFVAGKARVRSKVGTSPGDRAALLLSEADFGGVVIAGTDVSGHVEMIDVRARHSVQIGDDVVIKSDCLKRAGIEAERLRARSLIIAGSVEADSGFDLRAATIEEFIQISGDAEGFPKLGRVDSGPDERCAVDLSYAVSPTERFRGRCERPSNAPGKDHRRGDPRQRGTASGAS